MNNQIEQKIKSIITKLDGTLNKPSNSYFLQNQERFYRIYKKLMSISIHCDTNVSAFELDEHKETSPDSSKENIETKNTLNKDENNNNSFISNSSSFSSEKKKENEINDNNEINIWNNKIDLDELLNILDKDLNDINDNNIQDKESNININENLNSPQNSTNDNDNKNNNIINENYLESINNHIFNENLKNKFLKIEEILKNYLENKTNSKNLNNNNNNNDNNNTKNIYYGGFRHSLDISGIFSLSTKSKRNKNNNVQILPNIVTNFFEDKEALKKELEEVNKRHSVVPGIEIKNYYHINSTSFKKLNKFNNFNSEEVKFKTKNNKDVSNFEQNSENSFVEGFDFLKVPKRTSLLPTFGNKIINIKEEYKEFDSFYDEENSNDSNDENECDDNNNNK